MSKNRLNSANEFLNEFYAKTNKINAKRKISELSTVVNLFLNSLFNKFKTISF